MNYTFGTGPDASVGVALLYTKNVSSFIELSYPTTERGACTGSVLGPPNPKTWLDDNTYQSSPSASWNLVSDCSGYTSDDAIAISYKYACTAKNTATVAPAAKLPGVASITTYNNTDTCTGATVAGEGFTQDFDSGSCLPYEPTNNSYRVRFMCLCIWS